MEQRLPGRFPARRTQRQRGFALIARYREENFAGDRDDVGDDHDGHHDTRSEETHTVGWSLKNRKKSQGLDQCRSDHGAHQWNDNENSKQTVDHTRNRG